MMAICTFGELNPIVISQSANDTKNLPNRHHIIMTVDRVQYVVEFLKKVK
jgi:hypothetical protein